jgi:hypothetical protein
MCRGLRVTLNASLQLTTLRHSSQRSVQGAVLHEGVAMCIGQEPGHPVGVKPPARSVHAPGSRSFDCDHEDVLFEGKQLILSSSHSQRIRRYWRDHQYRI